MINNKLEKEDFNFLNLFKIDSLPESIDFDNSMDDEKSILVSDLFSKSEGFFNEPEKINGHMYNKYIEKNSFLKIENHQNDEKTGFTSVKNKNKIKENNLLKNLKNHKIKSQKKKIEHGINNINIINNLNQEKNDNSNNKEKKLGRKTKSSENKTGGHDKFSDDNLIRKIKCILLDIISTFINSLLKVFYENNIGKGENRKELLKMNQSQIISSKADYNKDFLKKTLKIIFSEKISSKYNKYDKKHNEKLIEKLLNEENEEIRYNFEQIFNLTFLDCLEHIRGSNYINILNGLPALNDICEKFGNDPDYVGKFKNYVEKFEDIIASKKVRNRISWKNQSKNVEKSKKTTG